MVEISGSKEEVENVKKKKLTDGRTDRRTNAGKKLKCSEQLTSDISSGGLKVHLTQLIRNI